MEQIYGSALVIVLTVVVLWASWRYGDWRNWQEYYPTMLFVGVWDFITTILTYEHRLWRFESTLIIPNHMLADFMIVFLHLAPMVLIYLSIYPYSSNLWGQVRYMLYWIVVNSLIEGAFQVLGRTTYHHKWGYWWSVLLWSILFLVVRLHKTRPLWAWLVCFGIGGFVIAYFDIPLLNRQ